MTRGVRLIALVAVLGGLVAWVVYTDRSGPAYPSGRTGELLSEAVIAVVVTLIAVAVWRTVRSWRHDPPER